MADRMSVNVEERENLLRRKKERYTPTEWNDDLPYGGKVFMARKRKPDPWYIKLGEILLVCLVVWLIYVTYYHYDKVHFHIVNAYAHIGHAEAQHQTGQRYMHGLGVEKHPGKAIEWFKAAAEKGHGRAAYDLAVSHINGHSTGLEKGEAKRLFHHAAMNGVPEAQHALNHVCSRGGCED